MIVATLDTGALIAIERRKPRGTMLLRAARERHVRLVTITPVVAEWWRGRTDERDHIKKAIDVLPPPIAVAEAAGIALGRMGGIAAPLTIDAMLVAFAALHGGGVVYTSDVGDLERVAAHFPAVRILGV